MTYLMEPHLISHHSQNYVNYILRVVAILDSYCSYFQIDLVVPMSISFKSIIHSLEGKYDQLEHVWVMKLMAVCYFLQIIGFYLIWYNSTIFTISNNTLKALNSPFLLHVPCYIFLDMGAYFP
jgi:hypothetical protein